MTAAELLREARGYLSHRCESTGHPCPRCDLESRIDAHLASQPDCVAVPDWDAISEYIKEYVADYIMEGDEGCYTPNEQERFILEDGIHGILADDEFLAKLRAAKEPK
jgi:hypothetical protein